jgi:Bacterial Ig-like domain (group 2)
MYAYLLAFAVACAPQPASIKLDGGDAASTVYTMDKVNNRGAKVLDAKGQEIKDAKVEWSVEPATTAKLSPDFKSVEPLAEGKATITAKVGDKVKAQWTLDVVVPDAVEITGATSPATVAAGQTLALTAAVKNDGAAIAELPITWSSSDAAIATVADGKVSGVAAGKATITATNAALSATLEVEVTAADAVAAEGAPAGAPTIPSAAPGGPMVPSIKK